jgi:GTP 3',8-cyclase
MDPYRIDSHKLLYHPKRLSAWIEGKNIYPLYMEVSPSGACNHRCVYCGLDFMKYQPRYLDTGIFLRRLKELGRLGVKSIMYAGEGEPLLHKDISKIVKQTKASGIDVAITTNGVLLKKEMAQSLLPFSQWIKVSINAGTKETYAKIHQCPKEDFNRVIENMREASKIRRNKKYSCTLGMQMVLLPDNAKEATRLASIAKNIGMDYLVIKPYSQHPQSVTKRYKNIHYKDYAKLHEDLKQIQSDSFSVIFRHHAMQKWDEAAPSYERCQAFPFWSYIDAGGNVWGCSVYLNDKRFFYGNIYETTFKAIWQGQQRKKSLAWAQKNLNPCRCRVNCRMDEVNRYLWDLKHPSAHVNFI